MPAPGRTAAVFEGTSSALLSITRFWRKTVLLRMPRDLSLRMPARSPKERPPHAECFGVDGGGDHESGVGVPALVKTDRLKARFRPSFPRAGRNASGVERPTALGGEREAPGTAPLLETMGEQMGAKRVRDRNAALPGLAFR
jgi:hypothetical protein